jgi:chemotaxis protein MotA
MYTVFFGLIVGIAVLVYSFAGVSTNSKIYLDASSLILVLGGTLSAALMSVTMKNLKELFKTIKYTFSRSDLNNEIIINELIGISESAASLKSLTSLKHQSKSPLIQKGIRLLQNEISPPDIMRILTEYINNEKNQIFIDSEILKSIAKYPPSFGMVGTILGLVGLLEEMSLATGMEKIGLKMAMALVTTLYGLLLANYIIHPLAEVIVNKAQSDLKIKKQILDTFILISSNKNDPVLVKEYLGVLGTSGKLNDMQEVAA